MRQLIASIASLLLAVELLSLANGMFATFIGLRASLDGLSNAMVGLMSSGYYAGFIVGTLACDRLIRATNHTRAFAALSAVNAALVVAFPLFEWPPLWVGLRTGTGFCMAGIFIVVESWLNARATARNRGTLLSLYLVVTYLGVGAGQLLINAADPADDTLFLLATMLYSLMAVPLAVSRAKMPPAAEPGARFGFGDLLRTAPLATVACLWAGISSGAVYGLGPVFAKDLGLDVAQISQFMLALVISGLLLQVPIGRLSDRYDRRRVIIGTALALVLICAAMVALLERHGEGSVWARAAPLLLGIAIAYGGVGFTVYGLGVALANDLIAPAHRVQAAGGLLRTYAVGATLGPAGAAALMSPLGPAGLFAFTGATAGGLLLFGLYRLRRYPKMPCREHFVALPEASTTPKPLGIAVPAEGEAGR